MGLFGKKNDDVAPEAAPAEEKTITAQVVGEQDGEKMYHCDKCNKDFKASEGNFVLEGSAFCCNECCPKDKAEGDDHEVCEFC